MDPLFCFVLNQQCQEKYIINPSTDQFIQILSTWDQNKFATSNWSSAYSGVSWWIRDTYISASLQPIS
jgi:hypothetical protein